MPRAMPRRAPLGLLTCALLATGCTGAAEPHPGAESRPRPGGTLYVLVESDDFPHIDPQRTHYTPATNVVRLFARTLTTYRPAGGRGGSELVPDLATDLGRPTQRNTVWQFTLKPNLKWEDGSEVTCRDVKYGVERSFSDLIDGGASIYPRTYLKYANAYRGPYRNGGAGLESIICLDPRTVQFELTRPVGDFGYVTALSVFAPVPPAKDTRQDYDRRPFSNGPYRVTSYDRAADTGKRELVLERNRHWSPRTDPARQQYPDKIVVRFGQNADAMTYRMIEDQDPHRYAVALDTRVSPRFAQQVINDPRLSARTVTGTTSGVRYLAINTRSVPDLVCRQAMVHAFNKRAFRTALGGSPYGDYASTILPPTMRAFRGFDKYGTISRPDGDLGRARMLMSGAKCPDTMTLDFMHTRLYSQAADVIVESYQRLGIRVVKNPIPADQFFDVVTVPSKQHDLVLTGWVPDFPNGSGTIPALFDGRSVRPGVRGNYNFSLVNDREINQLIDATHSESDLRRQYRMWGELDRKIQEKALVVPIMYDRALQLLGSQVRGGFLHPAY
ncbi:MAG TPA: ABC transporter substrate-binding protein, partial [Micromonosporaceae bacterium]